MKERKEKGVSEEREGEREGEGEGEGEGERGIEKREGEGGEVT